MCVHDQTNRLKDVSSYQVLERGRAPRVKQLGIISGTCAIAISVASARKVTHYVWLGAPCGSIYIDKAFEDALSERGILEQLSNDEKFQVRQQFILQKESFVDDPSTPKYHIHLPRAEIVGELIMAGYFQISR